MEGLLSPPPGGDRDQGPTVLTIYWSFFTIELIVISLRMYARIKIRALGPDDWIMVFTMLLVVGLNTVGTLLVKAGGCRPIYYIIQDEGLDGLVKVKRLWLITQPFALMAVAVGRTSVAVLILRILGQSKWRRRFLYFSIISTLIISTVTSILLFTGCSPPKASWDSRIQAHCWSSNVSNDIVIFASSWNVLMDICIALLPVTVFWNLQLSLTKRVGLSILMGMGVFAGASGALKTSKITESLMTSTYDLFIWNGVETFFIIFCGCIPTLKPIYDQIVRNRRHNNRRPKNSKASGCSTKSPRPAYQVSIVGPNKQSNSLQLSDLNSSSSANLEATTYQINVRTDITQTDGESQLSRNEDNGDVEFSQPVKIKGQASELVVAAEDMV